MNFNSDFKMLIDGDLVPSDQTMEVINPASATTIGHCPRANAGDLDRAVVAAARAQKKWKHVPVDERRAMLVAAGNLIIEHAEALSNLFTREQGRPVHLARPEVEGAGGWFLATAQLDLPVDVTEDTAYRRIEVHHEPLGVVCGIVPWNFPVLLACWKIAPALLTGNTIVLKPSPYTPLATLKIAELLRSVFPAGVLNIISGGDELGPLMTAHPGFAKITFTGSTATGKKVMESAARDLKRVTLELGGNDAAIVFPDVNPEKVSEQLFHGAFHNVSQVCVATKRLYVHEDIFDEVYDRLKSHVENARMGDGTEQGTMFGPIQNKPQFDRVSALFAEAVESGLDVFQGQKPDLDGYFFPLTLVNNPPEDARVVTEEAFGPILPVLKFKDTDDVIRRANDSPYGLAGAVWSANIEFARQVAARLDTGTVWINQNLQSTPFTPLAGHKHSGIGVENGVYGLREFTVPKSIYIPKSSGPVS